MASNRSEIRHDFSAGGSTSTTTAPMETAQAVVPLEWSIGTLVSDQDSRGKGSKDDVESRGDKLDDGWPESAEEHVTLVLL